MVTSLGSALTFGEQRDDSEFGTLLPAMTIDEFFERIEKENNQRHGTHTLFPALTDIELQSWKAKHRNARLPADLMTLLRRSNGLGLHQSWYDGEPIYHLGAIVIFPLEEIRRADEAMYGIADDDPRMPGTRMAFSSGPDSSVFYGYDSETLHFWVLEPILPEESEDLGPSIGPVLELMV